jgi:hypothetical protein
VFICFNSYRIIFGADPSSINVESKSASGKNQNAFKPKKNNKKKKGRHGKDAPELLDPSVYPMLVFLSDVDPETIVSRVMHEFCCGGGFYFQKMQLQCVETVTPFIIFYLYTFNDIATLRAELTDLLKKAHEELESNFMLLEEFEYSKIPEINIRRGVPKLPGQDLSSAITRRRCRRRDEHT